MANNDGTHPPTRNGNTNSHESPKNHRSVDEPTTVVDGQEVQHWSFYRAVVAEFVATLLLLYVSLTALVGATSTGAGSVGILEIAWAFGGMIFVLVYCTAGLSGKESKPSRTACATKIAT